MDREIRPGPSIFQKLAGLIVVVTIVIVGGLSIYFPAREIRDLRQALAEKGLTYGHLLSTQMQSAIAFDDRETAREVAAGLKTDPQLASMLLVNAQREVVHSFGTTLSRPRHDIDKIVIETVDDRLTVFAPVISIEGPRGALVVELSTARISDAKTSIIVSAIVAALLALALGVSAAWWIARSLAHRLRNIGSAARRVANGDLTSTIEDPRADEIGALASVFTVMVGQIRELLASREEQARLEQQRLETLVAERTGALDARTRALAFVLDNVDQGLFTVDFDGRLRGETSAAVESLLGPIPADRMLSSYVAAFAFEQAAWFDACWSYLRDDLLPLDLALDHLPRRFVVNGRELEVAYKLVDDGGQRRVLVVITDISGRIARERAERDQQELGGLVTRLLTDRQGFFDFVSEIEQRIASVGRDARDAASLAFDVHTMKGSAAVFGLGSIAELCHEIENHLANDDRECAEQVIGRLVDRWQHIATQLKPLTSVRADL
ncbi:MAG: HAMP domain-containing protein, partial [Deltaproteobacteria bacterium]|nr:HAMP domain-containing protein [Deltaproteobacteria bacterium]